MFTQFFYRLKNRKIPVSTAELIDLLKAVSYFSEKNGSLSVSELYSISRNCLVKDVKHYDDFDLIFAEVFKGQVGEDNEMKSLIEEWLKKAIEREIPEEQKNAATKLEYEEVLKKSTKKTRRTKRAPRWWK